MIGIAACDPRGVMGKDGGLPWYCPADLKHFLQTIGQHPVVMGHRTFLSLPGRFFDQRQAIVFTRQQRNVSSKKSNGIVYVSSLSDFLKIKKMFCPFYVIGGSQIYNLFLSENLLTEFILTRLKTTYEGDTFFPLFRLNGWQSAEIQETNEFRIYRYVFHHKFNLLHDRCN